MFKRNNLEIKLFTLYQILTLKENKGQKRTENDPKTTQKQPKTTLKRLKNDPKYDPKTNKNDPKIALKRTNECT